MLLIVAAGVHHTPAWSEPVRIGVLAFQGPDRAIKRWSPTAQYLTRSVPGHTFVVVPLDLTQMRDAMASRQIDFALTNPGNYVELEAEFGISRIATLRKRSGDQISTQFGAVVFVRADRDDIHAVTDLPGRSLMAVGQNAFGGFQMAWGLLREHGIDPFRDLSELRFSGFPQDQIVFAVRDRLVDVGTVRSDVLERLANEQQIRIEDFRVLNLRESDELKPLHSTLLYPEWPFAKLRHAPRQLSQNVAVALLTLPEDGPVALAAGTAGWTIPLDYSAVHELFRTLNIGPYADPDEVSLARALRALAPWLAGGVLIVLLMGVATVYVTRTNRRLAESEQALRREIGERKHAQETLAKHSDTLEERVVERTEALARLNEKLQEDISARKKAEEALLRSDVALRDISATTSNPQFDHRQKIERVLHAGLHYFSMRSGYLTDVSGVPFCSVDSRVDRPSPDSASDVEQLAKTTATSREPVFTGHGSAAQHGIYGSIRCYVGAPVAVEGQIDGALLFVSRDAMVERFTAVDIDILHLMAQWIGHEIERQRTEERAAVHEAELNHVSRLNVMGELATGLAHEINQPLTAIANYTRGCMHRLRNENFDRGDLLNAMELAVNEAERASAIIRHLREFLATGDTEAGPTCLNSSVDAVLRLAGAEAKRRRIAIATDLDGNLPTVEVNAIQIEQVILNLLNNAIEAITGAESEERSIVLNTGVDGGVVVLSVSDSGPGLTAADQDRLFDPFFTTKRTGMGLGLPISRSIIDAYGGELTAISESQGGATFRVALPIGVGQ